jgi:hypothetical protein
LGAKSDDGVCEFYRFIAERVDIGIVLFNIPTLLPDRRASDEACRDDSQHLRLQARRPAAGRNHPAA